MSDWIHTEFAGYAYYAALGYRVLAPLVRNDGYDFVVEKDGRFKRVNVKTAGLKNPSRPNSWSISRSSGAYKPGVNTSDVDEYLVWLPHQKRFVTVEGNYMNGGNSKSKLLPQNLLRQQNT